MNAHVQEWAALLIVGATGLLWLTRLLRRSVAPSLSAALLKRGHVKWAMRFRRFSRQRGCC